MTNDRPSFAVNVDVTNPGQFFACCGLLELANRLWPGAEGAFDESGTVFKVFCHSTPAADLQRLMEVVTNCEISGLTKDEREERAALDAERNRLKREGKPFSAEKEKRRKELGAMARAGAISLRWAPSVRLAGISPETMECMGETSPEKPFSLDLNWWQTSDDDVNTPKTWAGLQEIHKVARAAQDAFGKIEDLSELFNHSCILRMPKEYSKSASDQKKSVEPFYFDARRFAHALDVGFSLDVQSAETVAHPAVELLALIGLQRFRPGASKQKWGFEYTAWAKPLSAPVATAVVSGAVPVQPQQRYRFRLLFRDDQRRYKAFSYATRIGGSAYE
jgi:hypothetical protein